MAKVKMITVDFLPTCPYCNAELEEIGTVNTKGFSITQLLVCPHCRKVLGPIYRG